MDAELERIKREVSLQDLVLEYGYTLDRKSSCRTSYAFRNDAQGSKIVVATDKTDGHTVFFDVFHQTSGSVLDFVMHAEHCNLGRARYILRERLTGAARPLPARMKKPEPVEVSLVGLTASWQAYPGYCGSYLTRRGLT